MAVMTMNELRAWLSTQPHTTLLDDSTPTYIHFRCDHSEGKLKRSIIREKIYCIPSTFIASNGSNVGVKEYKISTSSDVLL